MTTILNNETIVIIHGFGAHRWLMLPLARRLSLAGYATLNWGYHSLFSDIETHAARLRADLEQLAHRTEVTRVHIVAHSMGSLVARQALLEGQLEKLQRIVLLCPPNRGSHAATRWQPIAGRLSRTLAQLSDHPEGFAAALAPTLAEHYAVAILAAQTDFVVRLESTYLPGTSGHTIVPGFHSSMLFGKHTADLTLQFIRSGNL